MPSLAVQKNGSPSKKKRANRKIENTHQIEDHVRRRYAEGAEARVEALCCPVSYDPHYLKKIPREILDKDYGCGDPSQFVREGEAVLDLGSGAGKICYIASQIVGPKGKVTGMDFNPAMLKLAKKYQARIAKSVGWSNVEFFRGRIQDLKTNLDVFDAAIKKQLITTAEDFFELEHKVKALSAKKPMIADNSVDVVISNCVLNLVRPEDKDRLFAEVYRVLKKGGRIAISDIVSDEEVPETLRRDPELWSGCISGAFQESAFLRKFEEAGFYGIKIEKRDEKPWRTIKGIEFRSVTVTAYKGKEGECWERNQAVIYKGPWKQVVDDDQHVLRRGVRMAVCDKTFQLYFKAPYRDDFVFIEPYHTIPLKKAKPFSCKGGEERHPRQTKGNKFKKTQPAESLCLDGGCC